MIAIRKSSSTEQHFDMVGPIDSPVPPLGLPDLCASCINPYFYDVGNQVYINDVLSLYYQSRGVRFFFIRQRVASS